MVDTVDPSKKEAARIISREPSGILQKMSEIVAWLGKVPGSLYQKIKERAILELELEKKGS